MYRLPKVLFDSRSFHRMRQKIFVYDSSIQDKFRIFERFKRASSDIWAKKNWASILTQNLLGSTFSWLIIIILLINS